MNDPTINIISLNHTIDRFQCKHGCLPNRITVGASVFSDLLSSNDIEKYPESVTYRGIEVEILKDPKKADTCYVSRIMQVIP